MPCEYWVFILCAIDFASTCYNFWAARKIKRLKKENKRLFTNIVEESEKLGMRLIDAALKQDYISDRRRN